MGFVGRCLKISRRKNIKQARTYLLVSESRAYWQAYSYDAMNWKQRYDDSVPRWVRAIARAVPV